MKDCLVELIYVVIGLELIVAGVGKLVWRPNPEQFVPWLPARARMAGAVVPYFEGATGIALLSLSPPLPVVALAFPL